MTAAPSDTWVQRTSEDYAEGFMRLLPTGGAWPREPDHVLRKVIAGLAGIWGDQVEVLAALLLTQESDPRQAIVMLPDWERNWGLPDACLAEPLSIADRHAALIAKMTMLGGQSRAFFIAIAAAIGYTVTIREFSPFMCGVSRCGDTRALDDGLHNRWEIGPPEIRFWWIVRVGARRLSWFRAASGQAGVDPHLRVGLATDLECLLRRYKPAHTDIIFDYSPFGRLDLSNRDDFPYWPILT